jgi:large subunit ribosomal protein L15
MKIHDLRPAEGSVKKKTRVGRGIAAGKGKTAGRGTKGQRSRAGASIPAWFEGGQTPLHQRIPKLRGFRNRFKIEYEVVNVGRISAYAEADRFLPGDVEGGRKGAKAPITVNQEILHAVGLVTSLNKPLKILGQGEVTVPLFVVADAFSKSAVAKIEAAGGTAQPLEIPAGPLEAMGVEVVEVVEVAEEPARTPKKARAPKAEAPAKADAPAKAKPDEATTDVAADEAASTSGSDA